jgi:hypothetical protein
VYLQVNVYRARDGWYLVQRIVRAGGRAPQTLRLVDKRLLCNTDHSLREAARVAAGVLLQESVDEDS